MSRTSAPSLSYDPIDIEIDWDGAVQAHTPTVRGWEKRPAVTG